MMKTFIIALLLINYGFVYAQSASKNYVKSSECLDETCTKKKEIITYYNGFGREIQTIIKGSGTNDNPNQGLSIKTDYDEYGRIHKSYLPGVVSGLDFQDPVYPYNEGPVYSENTYENSPLNKIISQAAPGEDWKKNSGNEVEYEYKLNNSQDAVFKLRAIRYSSNFSISYAYEGVYAPNVLRKKIVKNENWKPNHGKNNTIEEFFDKEGRIVLSRIYSDNESSTQIKHDTYYIYDSFGSLTYILPPKLSDKANDQSFIDTHIGELGYQYKYDEKGRLIEKKLPGKDWEFMIYDNQNRLVAIQDGNMRQSPSNADSFWIYTKYDKYNRAVITGKIWNEYNRSDLQNIVNNLGNNNVTYSAGGYLQNNYRIYYNTEGFGSDSHVLTVVYYDRYPGRALSIRDIEGQKITTNSIQLKGLPTQSATRILDTNNFEVITTFYEERYLRPVRTHKTNYLGGYSIVDRKLDFRGKPTKIVTKHKRESNNPEIITEELFTYDHAERLVIHSHQVNDNPKEYLSRNKYNSLGQLVQRKIGNQNLATPYQTVDYRFNIRGWLTDINDLNLNTTDPFKDLFSFKINYNKTNHTNNAITPTPQYNGSISQIFWKSGGLEDIRAYDYTYDNLNQLIQAKYSRGEKNMGTYDENISYDKNGNITRLQRNGQREVVTPMLLDDLTYYYQPNSNKLLNVSDSEKRIGFTDHNQSISTNPNNHATNDYHYDLNGNLTQDLNKGITQITYNYLGLPTEIYKNASNKINYVYNAAGGKIKKIVTIENVITVTDYIDGYQYVNNKLQFFPHVEGYVNVVGKTATDNNERVFNYVYNYTDNQGNIRLSYAWDSVENKLKILKETHYYPFGVEHRGYSDLIREPVEVGGGISIDIGVGTPTDYSGSNKFKYKYNGQEYQDELGLNWTAMDFRNYDPVIGRFFNIDPMSELAPSITPYRFAYNNPISFNDPSGLCECDIWDYIYDWLDGAVSDIGDFFANSANAITDFASNLPTGDEDGGDFINADINDGWGIKEASNGDISYTYDPTLTRENYFLRGYSDYSDSRFILSSDQYGDHNNNYAYFLGSDGRINGQYVRGGIKTPGGSNINGYVPHLFGGHALIPMGGPFDPFGFFQGGEMVVESYAPQATLALALFTRKPSAAKTGSFGEKLFLSEKFGITSETFANSITGVKGTWNNQGSLLKMGWSTQSKYGGGMQLRIGIGSKVGSPNQAWRHIYVPKTFVPNNFANPSIQVKQSLFKLGQ